MSTTLEALGVAQFDSFTVHYSNERGGQWTRTEVNADDTLAVVNIVANGSIEVLVGAAGISAYSTGTGWQSITLVPTGWCDWHNEWDDTCKCGEPATTAIRVSGSMEDGYFLFDLSGERVFIRGERVQGFALLGDASRVAYGITPNVSFDVASEFESITAERIEGGVLKFAPGEVWLDVETGEFSRRMAADLPSVKREVPAYAADVSFI